MRDDQGILSPLVTVVSGGANVQWLAYHLDCFLKGILPHGPECPHCRGLEPKDHAPSCTSRTSGLCDCQPMPPG